MIQWGVVSRAARHPRRTAGRLWRRTNRRLWTPRGERILAAAGAVDADWVAAQLAREPGSLDARAAARHYLRAGSRLQLSPLPTFEPTWFAPQWRGDGADPMLSYLRHGPGLHGPHPLVVEPSGDARAAVSAAAGGALPVPPDWPSTTLADLRERLDPLVATLAFERERKGGRISHTWDEGADRAYVARLRGAAPVPTGDGPVVSVVLPVRNRPVQIASAVASVQAQDFPHWELLVVDDGSTDTTPDVVAALAKADPRVRLLQRAHSGVCLARNAGVAAARGDFVAFLDSDNTWRPHFLGTALAAMALEQLPAAYAVIHEIGASRFRVGAADPAVLATGNVVDLNVLVVRTDLLREVGGFDPTLRRMVDYDLAWRLALRVPLTLLPFVGADYDNDLDATDRISTTEPLSWGDVVRTRHAVDLSVAASRVRQPGLVSVVVPATSYPAAAATVTALVSGVVDSGTLEVVVVDGGTPGGTARLLHGVLPTWPGVRVVRLPRDLHRAGGFNVGLAETSGAVVVFVDEGVTLPLADLQLLVGAVKDRSVGLARPATLRDRVAVARAQDWFAVAGMDPLFTLGYEVQDVADRIAAEYGSVATVELAGMVSACPARVPDEGTARANREIYARRAADRQVTAGEGSVSTG